MPILIYVASPLRDWQKLVCNMIDILDMLPNPRVACFDCPESVLEALKSADPKPAILITSIVYQGHAMSGIELYQECKKVHPGLKVLLTSSLDRQMELEKCPIQPDVFFRIGPFLRIGSTENLAEKFVEAVKKLLV